MVHAKIVSDTHGTTRDTIEEAVNLDGVPIRLLDTAGLRTSSSELEREGIELELLTGGEISTGRLPRLSGEELDALRLGDGPYLLIEAPLTSGAWQSKTANAIGKAIDNFFSTRIAGAAAGRSAR